MNKQDLKKLIIMLLIINFNFVLSINSHSSFFHNQTKSKIKLADYQTPTKKPIDKYNNAVKKITIRNSRLC
ncbi:hypothetical protein [Mulberry dwarf phytoplasma]|uniref:hypothetical protein n=1 Tax=Mulberry dwarf phytoplasma TaxID=186171 RepID=UPI001D0F802A|nr:hypothetical protein [Mulberry dwarf phytoplasma]